MQKWALSQGGPELEARLARLVAPQKSTASILSGWELDFAKAAIAPVLWLYRNYFRVETHGIEQVRKGACLISDVDLQCLIVTD